MEWGIDEMDGMEDTHEGWGAGYGILPEMGIIFKNGWHYTLMKL